MKEERRARAVSKQIKFRQDLSRLVDNVGHDHCYYSTETNTSQHGVKDKIISGSTDLIIK